MVVGSNQPEPHNGCSGTIVGQAPNGRLGVRLANGASISVSVDLDELVYLLGVVAQILPSYDKV